MCFPSLPFPPATPVFPPASHVQKYLESYAVHFALRPFIRLNTAISDVRRDSPRGKWKVSLRSSESMDFDFVIVANGHHSVPRYPAVPGLDAWLAAGKAQHALWYRRPPPHENRTRRRRRAQRG
jgi:cation diffusion facilitator CzcD-associated flavoprotein CzcO